MNTGRTVAIVTIWAGSLFGVAAWASQSSGADTRPAPTFQMGEPHGEVITGADFGFQRIAAPPDRDGRIAGRLMVRVDGQWREVTFPPRIVR